MSTKFWRALDFVFRTLPLYRPRASTHDDIGNTDLATDENLTIFDSERLLLDETGAVVGMTAIIDGEGLTLTGGKLPPGTETTFEENKADILAAAKCTSCLLIEEGELDGKIKRRYFGTAFFVTDHLLLTAGHNVVGVNGRITRICITTPGFERIHPWQENSNSPMIECRLVGTIYKRNGPHSRDIAILDSGAYKSPNFIPLSTMVPQPNASVDIVGYPAEIRHEWIEAQDGLLNPNEGQQEAMRLLPNGCLTVTRGTVEAANTTIPYHISTCPGMGGSCALFRGVVIGKH